MHSKAPSGMQVVKKEDKENNLKDFIATAIATYEIAFGAVPGPLEVTLIARSVESPVARALTAYAATLATEGISVRAILASDTGVAELTLACPHFFGEVRLARNLRLLDAHEQLVLGAEMIWMGDTMRRDPSKRDAYESYSVGSAENARWAQTCFDRMWVLSEKIVFERRIPEPANVAADGEPGPMDPLVVAALDLQQIPAATRH